MPRPRILCISLSPIARDARVLRQVVVLGKFGDVTTVGYGPRPPGVFDHIEVPADLLSLPQTLAGVLGLTFRRFRRSEMAAPAIRFFMERLGDERFDLVVANEARVLAAAFAIARDAPVWADMHEWAPEERTHVLVWKLLVAPLMDHLCREYLPRAAAVTTVGGQIASLYEERYAVSAGVMRNTPAFVDLAPSTLDGDRIRLVHSGGAVAGRNLEGIIDAVARLDDRFTLDMYLVTGGEGERYLRTLSDRAGGSARIRFHAPVSPEDLPATLNGYDIGVYWMPPTNTNSRLALPNKLFDFVQARLAVAIGPSVEMERVLATHDLGVVSDDFSVDACVRSLSGLTRRDVERFKRNADAAARDLSFEHDGAVAEQILRTLLAEPSSSAI